MNSHLIKKGMLIGLNIIDLIGIIAFIFIYTSSFLNKPLFNIFNIKMIIPMTFVVLIINIGFYILYKFIYLDQRRRLILLLEMMCIFITDTLFEVFNYAYSLVIAISIINVTFYIIILCEISIYIVKNLKSEEKL